jgi:hypothetical protein
MDMSSVQDVAIAFEDSQDVVLASRIMLIARCVFCYLIYAMRLEFDQIP